MDVYKANHIAKNADLANTMDVIEMAAGKGRFLIDKAIVSKTRDQLRCLGYLVQYYNYGDDEPGFHDNALRYVIKWDNDAVSTAKV